LENCSAVALIVSPNSVSSGWVQEEYYRAISLTKNFRDPVQLIPVILEDAEAPGFLKGRNWVDFRDDKQYSKNVWRLVWGITGEKPKNIIALRSVSNGSKTKDSEAIPPSDFIDSAAEYKIIDGIQNLIALHGLDDDAWARAISAQYFLVGIADLMDMVDQQDYVNLLNKFLGSFHHLIDDTLVLEGSRVLVTPEESRRILQCMKEEDLEDPYYRQSEKTKAENISPVLLHDNYLYGLITQITQTKKYPILQDIHKLAIDNLLYGKDRSPVDEYGGWYPYRVPWITARILISLKNSNYLERSDASHIDEVINKALESLVRRIYRGKYWRSGVGAWVSKWESTALCLEALDRWDYIGNHKQKIEAVVSYAVNKEDEWMVDPPNFQGEVASNDTLAAVSLICVILRAVRKQSVPIVAGLSFEKYARYLEHCVDILNQETDFNSRQFCTIPQVAYYIVSAFSK
jgi:hypothetical protein